MGDVRQGYTVGELREQLNMLPDHAQILVECGWSKFDVERAFAIGMRTDDPGLVIRVVEI